MKRSTNYEKFHDNTSMQRSIISESNFTYKIILNVFSEYLTKPNLNVLDIGCGSGSLCLYLANEGHKVTGIDISRNAIEACKQSARYLRLTRHVKFKQVDFPKQILSQQFDFIICSEVIEHLVNDKLALKKIFFLLQKGGIAIISTPSKNAPLYRLGYAKKFDREVGHLRRYTEGELIRLCNDTGFEIVRTKKTEGIIRNSLYIFPFLGKFIRFIRFFLVDLVLLIDYISLKMFGESDLFIIVRRPK